MLQRSVDVSAFIYDVASSASVIALFPNRDEAHRGSTNNVTIV